MKHIAIVLASFFVVTAALADDSCKVQADTKNLHGAALTSFPRSAAMIKPPRRTCTAPHKQASPRSASLTQPPANRFHRTKDRNLSC